MCYNKSVNRRGADHLPLKLSLKVGILSPMILTIFSHRSLSKGLFAHFTSFLWYRVGGAPDYHNGFHSKILSDDGERPVTARKMRLAMWKEYTHTLVGETAPWLWNRHWRLGNRRATNLLPSGVIVARGSLKPWAKGRNLPWQPD